MLGVDLDEEARLEEHVRIQAGEVGIVDFWTGIKSRLLGQSK
jgi:hypothetical protein